MKITKWQRLAGLIIVAGVLLKLFDAPYGKLIFTIGFGALFLLKLIKLLSVRIRLWTAWHYWQLFFLLLAAAGLLLMYYEYPYSRVVFVTGLGGEELTGLRIKANTWLGSQNVSNLLRLFFRFVFSRPASK